VTILQFFLWSLLKVAVVTVVMLLGVAYTVLLERKLVGRIQNRWGPAAWALSGSCSRWLTGQKSFLKEDIIPTGVYRPLYLLRSHPRIGLRADLYRVVPFGAPKLGRALWISLKSQT